MDVEPRRFVLVLAALLFTWVTAAAQPGCADVTPDEIWKYNDKIFLGKVISTEVSDVGFHVTVEVTEGFRDAVGGDQITFFERSRCMPSRKPGQTYIFALRKDDRSGKYYSSPAINPDSRDQTPREVLEVFRWKAGGAQGGGILAGRIVIPGTNGGSPLSSIVKDLTVVIRDETGAAFETRVESDGVYIFRGLAPGTYLIEIPDSPVFRTTKDISSFRSSIADNGGGSVIRQFLELRSAVSGRVVDTNGNPLEGFFVKLTVLEDGNPDAFFPLTSRTDSDGRYQFEQVLPGEAYLQAFPTGEAVGPLRRFTATSPPNVLPDVGSEFTAAYIPNVKLSAHGQLLEMRPGMYNRGLDLVSKKLPLRPLTGRVVSADGTPAAGVPIMVRASRIVYGSRVEASISRRVTTTDSAGAFSFMGFEETEYEVRAVLSRYTNGVLEQHVGRAVTHGEKVTISLTILTPGAALPGDRPSHGRRATIGSR